MSNTHRTQTTLVFAAESSSGGGTTTSDHPHVMTVAGDRAGDPESVLPEHTLVKRKGWGRDKCVVVVVAFTLVAAVAGAFALATYITSGGSLLESDNLFPGKDYDASCNEATGTGCGGVAKDDGAAFSNSTTTQQQQQRVGVVLGNGCFWERQYAYVMLEHTDSLFGRGLYNFTSRAGYAGGLGTGTDGKVCYHHSGGDQSDIYSTLGHAEGVQVWLDVGAAADEQFELLFRDFLDSFTYSSALGGNVRPDPGDMGAEYRSFLVLPGGVESDFFRIAQKLNDARTHPLDLVAGGTNDGDVLNAVFVYDSLAGYHFYDAEPYHQFHSNFFGKTYPTWYLNLNAEYIDAGLVVDTGCPQGMHWLRR